MPRAPQSLPIDTNCNDMKELIRVLDEIHRLRQAEIAEIEEWLSVLIEQPHLRRAEVEAVESSILKCKLLDKSGDKVGDQIEVTPSYKGGSNDLDGDVWPKFEAGDVLAVFEDVDENWYMVGHMDDTME